MEGCPRLPMLSFDLKSCMESVNLCEKIPSYISSNYQESGEKYLSECEQINRLRQSAIDASADLVGVQLLKKYYCQLQLLRNRFPMLPDTECAVRFTWEDAYQKDESSFNDARFEETAILYNIGAIYTHLAGRETRKTHDSIKNSCTYYRCAAWAYQTIRDQYTAYTPDLSPDLLTYQFYVVLAQAHETVLEKSLLDQRPASVNAHIAMQISEYYQMALVSLTKPGINSIVSKKFKKLSGHLPNYIETNVSMAKQKENKKRGEAVCYYEAAVERLQEAWKSAAKISNDKLQPFQESHTFSTDVIVGKYKSAKRDNDSVFFEKVPALSSLTAVQGAIVAKPQSFDFQDPEVCGPDIFQRLLPMDTHLAASEYSEEKAKLLREVVELVENKNRELETFLLCLQLDRVPLDDEYLRLPRDLFDCCAVVAVRPNMPKDLASLMQQLNSQHHDLEEQVEEFNQELKIFIENGNDAVKQNKELKSLQSNLKTTIESLSRANENDVELHKRMVTISQHLKLLGSPLDQLEKTLPVITELHGKTNKKLLSFLEFYSLVFLDENNKPKLSHLKTLAEKIEVMRKQREQLINDFRKKIHEDDITTLMIIRRQDSHKNLFVEQLKKHEELINIIKQNCAAQENILQMLTEANADFAEIRSKITATSEARTNLINDYINSFKSFQDVTTKANEGIEFYKKLTSNLEKLIERFSTVRQIIAKQQPPSIPSRTQLSRTSLPTRSNQEQIDREFPSISPLTSIPTSTSTMPDRPRLKDYLAIMKPETWGTDSVGRSKQLSSSDRLSTLQDTSMPSTNYYETQQLPSQFDSSFNPQFQANRSNSIPPITHSQPNLIQQPQWQDQLPSSATTRTLYSNSISQQLSMSQYDQSQKSLFTSHTSMSQPPSQQNFNQQPFSQANISSLNPQAPFNQYTNQQQTPFTHPQPHVQNQSIHNQYPSSPQEQQQRFTSQSTLQNPPVNPIVSTHYPQSVIPPSFHQPFGSVNNSLSSQYQMPPLSSQQQQQQQYQSASIPVPQTKFDPYRPQPAGAYEIPKLQPYQPQSNVLSTVQYPQHWNNNINH
ncbi:unnamed protein product [Didymodactylos carnosus]|uniref:BRO1 domain-containing protein n=1 Tax=Didymodactylos carnosus TaxID=1234261 RepID=A0A813SVU6_9BILA|nr:unnamed protein product [Didymodactylos carnosus]CAF3588421.1 unnamed protein product [Didymodactylos carnosus]